VKGQEPPDNCVAGGCPPATSRTTSSRQLGVYCVADNKEALAK